jgi:S1-C subfamily serine protease
MTLNKGPSQPNIFIKIMIGFLLIFIGLYSWHLNHQSDKRAEGSKQPLTKLPIIQEKVKEPELNPQSSSSKKDPEGKPDGMDANNIQAPVPLEITGNPTSSHISDHEQMDLEKLAAAVVPCVFLIEVYDKSGSLVGKGTGFSISADGWVATNHHVIEKGQTYIIVTNHGAKFGDVEIIVSDPNIDLALLKIGAKDMPYLPLAESSKVPIGKRVAVYGSPQGLAGSLSEGIISASERNLSESFPDEKMPNNGALIQTTAPISPGSSGSPLFGVEGKVIGIMTLSLLRNSQSLNFAIPVEALKSLIDSARTSWITGNPKSRTSVEKSSLTNSKLDTMIEAEPAFRRLQQQMSVSNWVESLKIAGFLSDKYPKSASIHFQHGYCAAMLSLDHQAELSYTKVIEIDPTNQIAWNNLGLAFMRQKKLQNALLVFEKAVSLNPGDPQAWVR